MWLLASLLVHGILLALVLWRDEEPWDRTRAPGIVGLPVGGGGSGGGGGGQVAYISLPPPPTQAAEPPQSETPPVEPPPEPVMEEPPAPEPDTQVAVVDTPVVATELAQAGVGNGADSGVGRAPGSGGGRGGGSGTGVGTDEGPGMGGEGGVGMPPEPRQLILPPFESPPDELRGRTVRVTFWVRPDGSVEAVDVDPDINDRDYADKFEAAMLDYGFRPARSPLGVAVPGTYTIDVDLTTR